MEAQTIWSMYPGQIAADLRRYYNVRIADWHQGHMSSYEMLELLEFLPDEGVFKTALRDGEWSQRQHALFQCANELAILRSAQVSGTDSEEWGSVIYLSPAKVRERAEVT